jgi:hypothetical protein
MLVLIRDGVICPAVSNILLKRTSTTGCPQPTDGCAVCLSELSYSQHLDGSTCEAGLTPAKSPPSGVSCECSAEYGTSASMLLARRSGLATLSWTSIPGQSDLTLTLSADGQTCSTQTASAVARTRVACQLRLFLPLWVSRSQRLSQLWWPLAASSTGETIGLRLRSPTTTMPTCRWWTLMSQSPLRMKGPPPAPVATHSALTTCASAGDVDRPCNPGHMIPRFSCTLEMPGCSEMTGCSVNKRVRPLPWPLPATIQLAINQLLQKKTNFSELFY